jgi:Uma2 family endonuclease
MSTVTNLEPISIDDYLRQEELSGTRHEYVKGVVYAMVGGTARHNLITGAIASALRSHLKGTPCSVFMSDMKVQTSEIFYYPDVMVVCDPVDPDSLYQTRPVLLVEVLSNSTESKDRLEKLVAYQSIPSLQEYILVAQDKVAIDIYRRNKDVWQLESLTYHDQIRLESVNYQADIETYYEDVLSSLSRTPTR